MEEHAVFDQETFGCEFAADLRQAQALVLIHTPYLTTRGVNRFRDAIAECIKRHVRVCAFLQEPREWKLRNSLQLEDKTALRMKELQLAIDALCKLAVHVSLRKDIHEKLAVIDDSVLWEGSLNILSYNMTSERMNRWQNSTMVQAAIEKHNLDSCDECTLHPGFKAFCTAKWAPTDTLKFFGKRIARRRLQFGLSQRVLAQQIGKSQDFVYQVEAGSRNIKILALLELCKLLKLELVLIPRHLLPAVLHHDHRCTKDKS